MIGALRICQKCGSQIPADPPAGACPACLLENGLGLRPDAVGVSGDSGAVDSTAIPRKFGDFEIRHRDDGSLWELGRGGMGVTYLAVDNVLRRKVALKVIDVPAAARTAHPVRERFLREARATAALRHPNVAAVYHFGASPDDSHCYYAMELVEGETLEARVRREGLLSAKLVLEIAMQITRALMAAAAHGLIHRDLKPGNIMLTRGDADTELEVKVIDFGLAKAIADAGGEMDLTRGGFVGTPNFASPEQFESGPVDVRSDIYSLGATLWFALTGKTPLAGRNIEEIRNAQKSNVLPVERLKAARVPPSLRSLLQSMLAFEPAARPAIQDLAAQLRRCSALADIEIAADVKKEIQLEIAHVLFIDMVGYSKLSINEEQAAVDELTQIVRSAEQFQKAEAAERLIKIPTGDGMALVFYISPDAPARCAMQISRALKEHPRLRVRMGIHSGPVSGIVDIAGATNLAGAGLNLAQRVMECGDAGHILLSKHVAEDLEEYEQWRPLLHDLGSCEVKHGVRVRLVNLYTDELGNPQLPKKFQAVKQHKARVRWVRATAVLLALAAIVALVIWQLRGQAEMKAEMAKLRQGIMNYPQMEAEMRSSQIEQNPAAVQEQTYAELGKQLGIDPKILREKLPRFAEELTHAPNASLYERANASYVAKDYAHAEGLALQAAGESQKIKPSNPKNILAALELAGLSAQKRIDYARAMEHFRAAEKLTDRDRDLEDWAILQHQVADLLVAQGKYSDAERVFRTVIDARARVLGLEHPNTLDSRHRLIYALTRQTKYPEAESEARAVLKLRAKSLGPEHPDTVVSRYDLADTLADQGEYAEAEDLYRNVIRLNEKALGSDHPRTISARVGLATVLGSEDKNAEAEPLYREIIKLDEKVYGPEDPNTLNDRMNLATALQADGKYSDAEVEYREVIKLEEKVIGAEHPDTLISRNNLAEVLDDSGKFAEAEGECRQIIDIETRVLGPKNRVTLNSRGNLAIALIGQGKFAAAHAQYTDVLQLMEHVLGLEHPDMLNYATKFAMALWKQNKIGEAMETAKRAEDRTREALGPDHPVTRKYAKLVQDLQAPK